MKKLSKKIFPSFLKKVDHYLLLNHPFLWSSRMHKLSFICALLVLIIVLLIQATPLSYTNAYYGHSLIEITCICLGIVIFIFWLFKQTLFNFGINHGKMKSGHYIILSLLFLMAFFSILSVMFIPKWYLNKSVQDKYIERQLHTKLYIESNTLTRPYAQNMSSKKDVFFDQLNSKYSLNDIRSKIALYGINLNGIKKASEVAQPYLSRYPVLDWVENTKNHLTLALRPINTNPSVNKKNTGYLLKFDLSQQTVGPMYSGKYNKDIVIHNTPTQVIKLLKNDTLKFNTATYAVDGEFFDAANINYRLVCEQMLLDLFKKPKLDKLKAEGLTGRGMIEIAGFGRGLTDKLDKIDDQSNLKKVHSLIYSSTLTTKELLSFVILFGGILAYFLFFTASIIKYFNLRTYLKGFLISFLVYFVFSFFDAYFFDFLFLESAILGAILMGLIIPIIGLFLLIIKVKRSTKIVLFQLLVFMPPIILLIIYKEFKFPSLNRGHSLDSNISMLFHNYPLGIDSLSSLYYAIILIFILFIVIAPFFSYQLHKIYTIPKSKT